MTRAMETMAHHNPEEEWKQKFKVCLCYSPGQVKLKKAFDKLSVERTDRINEVIIYSGNEGHGTAGNTGNNIGHSHYKPL